MSEEKREIKIKIDVEKLAEEIEKRVDVKVIVEAKIKEMKERLAMRFIGKRFKSEDVATGIYISNEFNMRDILVEFLDFLESDTKE